MKNIIIFLFFSLSLVGCGCGLDLGNPAPLNVKHYLAVPGEDQVIYSTQSVDNQDDLGIFRSELPPKGEEKLDSGIISDFFITPTGDLYYFKEANGVNDAYHIALNGNKNIEKLSLVDSNGTNIQLPLNYYFHVHYFEVENILVVHGENIFDSNEKTYFSKIDPSSNELVLYDMGANVHDAIFVNSAQKKVYWLDQGVRFYQSALDVFNPQLVKQLPESAFDYAVNNDASFMIYENYAKNALFSLNLQTGQVKSIFNVSSLGQEFTELQTWKINPTTSQLSLAVGGSKKALVVLNFVTNQSQSFLLNPMDDLDERVALQYSADGNYLLAFESDYTSSQLEEIKKDPSVVSAFLEVRLNVLSNLKAPPFNMISTGILGKDDVVMTDSQVAFDMPNHRVFYGVGEDVYEMDLIGFNQTAVWHRSEGVNSTKLAEEFLLVNTSDGAFLSGGEILFAIDLQSSQDFQITAD